MSYIVALIIAGCVASYSGNILSSHVTCGPIVPVHDTARYANRNLQLAQGECCRRLRVRNLPEVAAVKGLGLVRIPVKEVGMYSWAELADLNGLKGPERAYVEQVSVFIGARSEQWRFCFDAVPRAEWLPIEVFEDFAWVPLSDTRSDMYHENQERAYAGVKQRDRACRDWHVRREE